MDIEDIKKLCRKRRYTAEERGSLIQAANEYGLSVPTCACADKWNDLAFEVYRAVKGGFPTSTGVFYEYRKNYTTIVGTERYDGKTSVRTIERLKRENKALFKELYKERI